MVTMQISVPESTAELLAQAVRDRQFADPSQYIAELIEADRTDNLDIDPGHRKWMNEQIQEALDSDPANDIPITPQFWEERRAELKRRIAQGATK